MKFIDFSIRQVPEINVGSMPDRKTSCVYIECDDDRTVVIAGIDDQAGLDNLELIAKELKHIARVNQKAQYELARLRRRRKPAWWQIW